MVFKWNVSIPVNDIEDAEEIWIREYIDYECWNCGDGTAEYGFDTESDRDRAVQLCKSATPFNLT